MSAEGVALVPQCAECGAVWLRESTRKAHATSFCTGEVGESHVRRDPSGGEETYEEAHHGDRSLNGARCPHELKCGWFSALGHLSDLHGNDDHDYVYGEGCRRATAVDGRPRRSGS